LKEKLKETSNRKKKNMNLNKSFGSDNEEQSKLHSFINALIEEGKNTVVGIGDVRKALKKNVFQIKTYEEGKSGQKPK
jgi:hypothetical protein